MKRLTAFLTRPTRRRSHTSSIARCALMACAAGFLAPAAFAQGPPVNVSVSPASGNGTAQTFAFTSSSAGGAGNVLWMEMLVSTYNHADHGCFMAFWPGSSTIGLADDNGNTWPMTGLLGSSTPIQNSQCRINLAASSLVISGNSVTVNVALTFLPGFTGAQQTWLQTGDNAGLMASWQQMGTWTASGTAPPTNVSVSPSAGTGLSQVFTATYQDPYGSGDINAAMLLVQTSVAAPSACYVQWDRNSNQFYLMNDPGNGWMTPVNGVAANSQCALSTAQSSASGSANTLTVNFAVTFLSPFTGAKNTYLLAYGNAYATASGWQQMGTWNVAATAQAPANVSVSPASGTGVAQTFAFKSSSVNGYSYIAWMQMIFNYGVDGTGACYFYYAPGSSTIYLSNDNGAGWVGIAVIGTAGTIENSQCRLDVGASSAVKSFNTVTLNLALTFKAGLPGPQNVYMAAGDNGGLGTVWQQMGTWTTTAVSSQPTSLVSVTPSAGTGLSQTFSYSLSNVNGYGYIRQVHMLIGNAVSDAGGCYVYFSRAANSMGLLSDTGWAGGVQYGTPGTAGTLSNSQCQLDTGATLVVGSGNNLTLNLALTFRASWAGARNNYLYAADRAQAVGWQQMGTWTVAVSQPPTTVSITPSSGTGLSQMFSYTVSSVNGASSLGGMYVLLNTSVTAVTSCHLLYNSASNVISLYGDAGAWLPSVVLGTTGSLSNNQCTLDTGASTVTTAGNNLTLNLAVGFAAAWAGTKNNYLYAFDRAGLISGRAALGTWNVAAAAQAPANVSVSPSSGTGTVQTFAFASSSVNGSPYLAWMQMIFNYGLDGAGGCLLYYVPGANTIYLSNDNGAGWIGSAVIGTAGTIENAQCRLDVGASSVARSFNTVTVRLALTFKAGLPGLQNTYLLTSDTGGLNSGWQQMGTWTTTAVSSQPTSLVSVMPNAGTGLSQTFSYSLSNVNGYGYIMWVDMLIGNAVSDVGGCYVYYGRAGNYLGLLSDTGWSGGVQYGTPGTAGTLSNSQCQVNTGASSVVGSGNNLTLNLAVTFRASWAGARNNLLYAADRGQATNWQQMGTWTVPAAVQPPSNVSVSPASGTGAAQTFAFTSSSPGGAGNVLWMEMLINSGNVAAHGCFMAFWPGSSTVGLADDNGNTWPLTGVLGSATPLQNSQCRVNLASSSVVVSGNNVTVNVALTFLPGFTGAQQTWLQTGDNAGLMAQWQQMGTWTVAGSPPAVSTTSLTGKLGVAFAPSLAASGGSAPYTWTLVSGSLPPGLTLSGSGAINGTPTAAGTYSPYVRVAGSDGALSASSPVSIVISATSQDFGITIPSGDQSIISGGAINYANYLITLVPQSGFQGPVAITWTASPATLTSQNVTLSSNSLPVGAGWSTTMIVYPPFGTTTGAWDITVTGTSGTLVHTAVAHFTVVNGPDFTVTVTAPSAPITAGQSGVYGVRVNAVNGFDPGANVNLSVSNMPAGAGATPGSLTLLADGSTSYFTVSTSATTTSGNFLVNGTGGGKSHGVRPSLTTQTNPAGTYTISGQVQQPNGAGIGGTTFEVRNSQNVVVANAGTDDSGNYSIPPLAGGQYTVIASSPYGVFNPASITYILSVMPGLSAQHRRLMTMNAAPPDDPPPPASRDPVKLPIGYTTTTRWLFPVPGMDARNILDPPGCWASPSANVTTTVTKPTQASVYFTVVFAVDSNAAAGAREFYCSYKDQHGVLQNLDGRDYLLLQPQIGGRITSNNKGMPGFTISVAVNGTSKTPVQTDADGYYTLSGIDDTSNVTIKPSYGIYSLQFAAVPNQGGQCQSNPTTCNFNNVLANKTQDFTVTPFTTVFLLHGIGQTNAAMHDLWLKLTGQSVSGQPGLDLSRFVVDEDFTNTGCNHISGGDGQPYETSGGGQLAQHIAKSIAPAGIVLVGYSMGGLVARDLLVQNYYNVLASHTVVGLITLGTPNWGYPYVPSDAIAAQCAYHVQDMNGGWNPYVNDPGTAFLSPFLSKLKQSWSTSSYGGYWFAAAGTYIPNPFRRDIPANENPATGCLHSPPNTEGKFVEPNNDGVVCRDSALYSANSPSPTSPPPTKTFENQDYVHTQALNGWGSVFIFGKIDPSNSFELFRPPANADPAGLFQRIVRLINEQ